MYFCQFFDFGEFRSFFYVGIAEYDNGTIKYEKKKKKEPLNVTKEQSHVILKLYNMRIEPSNVRKKRNYRM